MSFKSNKTLTDHEHIVIETNQNPIIIYQENQGSFRDDEEVKVNQNELNLDSSLKNSEISNDEFDGKPDEKLTTLRRFSRLFSSSIAIPMFEGNFNTEMPSNKSSEDDSGDSTRSGSGLFNCSICQKNKNIEPSSLDILEGISGYGNCQKEHVFCRPCLSAYTNFQIENGIKNHPCPLCHEGCDGVASVEEIKTLSTHQNFELFMKLTQEEDDSTINPILSYTPRKLSAKSTNTINTFIQCPNCFAVITGGRTGNKQYPITTCISSGCETSFCFYHGLAHPPEITCLEFSQQIISSISIETGHSNSPLNKSFNTNLNEIKYCPECKTATRKLDQYNSIYCSYCRQCWCWLCDRKADANHYMPWNIFHGCPGQETIDWETIRLSASDENELEKLESRKNFYGRTVFLLFALYTILRYLIIVLPIFFTVLGSALFSCLLAPIYYVAISYKIKSDNAPFSELSNPPTCSIPYVSKKLPFAKLEDYLFISTIYLSAFLLNIYSCMLCLFWCPLAGLILTVCLLYSNEQILLDAFNNLIGNAFIFGLPDVVQFLIWPLGLTKYIFKNIFE